MSGFSGFDIGQHSLGKWLNSNRQIVTEVFRCRNLFTGGSTRAFDGDLQLVNAVKAYAQTQLDARMTAIVGGATGAGDTLGELQNRISAPISIAQGTAI